MDECSELERGAADLEFGYPDRRLLGDKPHPDGWIRTELLNNHLQQIRGIYHPIRWHLDVLWKFHFRIMLEPVVSLYLSRALCIEWFFYSGSRIDLMGLGLFSGLLHGFSARRWGIPLFTGLAFYALEVRDCG